jgi:hypothetical protein
MPVEGAAATAAGLAPGEHVAIVACTGWKPKVVIFEVTRAGAGSLDVTLRREP